MLHMLIILVYGVILVTEQFFQLVLGIRCIKNMIYINILYNILFIINYWSIRIFSNIYWIIIHLIVIGGFQFTFHLINLIFALFSIALRNPVYGSINNRSVVSYFRSAVVSNTACDWKFFLTYWYCCFWLLRLLQLHKALLNALPIS